MGATSLPYVGAQLLAATGEIQTDPYRVLINEVWASPETRHTRLVNRVKRRLTMKEAVSRDKEEIEDINKGGPIAMADFSVINETSLDDLRKEIERIIFALRWKD